jgi:hypothetical protein
VLTTTLPPRRSTGPVPPRLAGSVRRTSSIDVSWPEGPGGPIRLVGRARDLVTPRRGTPNVAAEDSFAATFGKDWTIADIAAEPPRPALSRLVGTHGARGFRKAVQAAFSGSEDKPLQLVLDDIPGATLVAGAAWQEWDPDWMQKAFGDLPLETLLKARENVCIGHATGSSAQDARLARSEEPKPLAATLPRSDDPLGWHAMEAQDGPAFRRLRRLDVSAGGVIRVDAEFQDSATSPRGQIAIHEYGLVVTADPQSFAILAIETDPRVLPYRECPSVAASLPRLIGVPLPELRRTVPVALAGAAGCTHLNEAFRGLAAVPALLAQLG